MVCFNFHPVRCSERHHQSFKDDSWRIVPLSNVNGSLAIWVVVCKKSRNRDRVIYHDDIFAFVSFRHLVMPSFRIFAKCCAWGEPLKWSKVTEKKCMLSQLLTSEAASCFLEDMYLVTTTLSPSVTQKFIKLGYYALKAEVSQHVRWDAPQLYQLLQSSSWDLR